MVFDSSFALLWGVFSFLTYLSSLYFISKYEIEEPITPFVFITCVFIFLGPIGLLLQAFMWSLHIADVEQSQEFCVRASSIRHEDLYNSLRASANYYYESPEEKKPNIINKITEIE